MVDRVNILARGDYGLAGHSPDSVGVINFSIGMFGSTNDPQQEELR